MRSLRGANAAAVIARLNPIIRGWAAYYRTVVSNEMLHRAGPLPVEAHLQVGQAQPPEQAEHWIVDPLLRHVQQVPAGPVGVRRPRQRRLPAPSSPGRRSSDTRWSRAPRPPTTRPWPTTGRPTATPRRNPQLDRTTARCSTATGTMHLLRAAPLARRPPAANPTRVGTVASRHRAKRWTSNAITLRQDGSTHGPQLRLLHAHCHRRTTGKRQEPALCTPASPQGLLEPDAWKPCTSGSEGAPAQQCAAATRPISARHRCGPYTTSRSGSAGGHVPRSAGGPRSRSGCARDRSDSDARRAIVDGLPRCERRPPRVSATPPVLVLTPPAAPTISDAAAAALLSGKSHKMYTSCSPNPKYIASRWPPRLSSAFREASTRPLPPSVSRPRSPSMV